jgi:hypothetical protein
MTYPMNVGRNFEEILRVIDALQTADAKQIATPADWMPGGVVIIPTSIMGTLRNRRNNNTDLRAAAVVGLGGVGFAVVGGWLSTVMSDRTSNVLFAALLVTVAARLLWQVRSESAAGSVEV